jgi:transposase
MPFDWEIVHQALREKGLTLLLLWREYRDIHPRGLSYSSFAHTFDFFGGVASIVVPHSHKEGVKKVHSYGPDINPNYQKFSEYYNVASVSV